VSVHMCAFTPARMPDARHANVRTAHACARTHTERRRLVMATHAGMHRDEDPKGKQPAHDDAAADGSKASNARETCIVSVRWRHSETLEDKTMRVRILTTDQLFKVRHG